MITRLAPPGNAKRHSGTMLASVLIVATWSAPVIASIDVDCDVSRSNTSNVEFPSQALSIILADHGIANATGETSLEPVDNQGLDLLPRIDANLEPILESTDSSSGVTTGLLPGDVASTRPLASSAITPNVDPQQNNTLADSVTTRGNESTDVETRLPGVSDADLVRFRLQMYRTDI